MNAHDWRRTATAVAVGAIALLFVVALATALGAPAAADSDDATTDESDLEPLESDGYAVVQGDRCIPVEPLGDGHQTVEEYYDYRNPDTDPDSYTYSSYGTTHLQADDTSILFLHEGSDGLSLVLVHDRLEGETDGGSLTMQIDDLPADGEWVVEDDDYEGQDDVFDHRETSSRITWVWATGRTDGAAFNGGLDDEFAITITPAFNEQADFRYDTGGYDGQLTDWEVLSGEDHDPQRTSLAMDEAVVVRSGGCTAVTDLDVNESATVGDEVTITATVTNGGEGPETVTVPFVVGGEIVDEQDVTLDAGESATLSTTVPADDVGSLTASVGETAATVEVADASVSDRLPGFGIGVALVAIVSVLVLLGRRDRRR